MKMRIYIAVSLFVLTGATQALRAASPPNVLIFLADDLGYGDLSCHGNPHVQTPELDRFAGDGVEMEHFYVAPACAPTRAGLMTGRYHYRTKVLDVGKTSSMSPDEITLAEILRAEGYATGMFGKWHLGDHEPCRPMDQGFDKAVWHFGTNIYDDFPPGNSYYDPVLFDNAALRKFSGYCMDVYTDEAIRFMESSVSSGKPFFVYLPTTLAHVPLDIRESEIQPFLVKGIPLATAKVYGMIKRIDRSFGRLIAALEEQGARDNTIVMFFSDNGPNAVSRFRFQAGLKGQKGFLYEGGVKVPFLLQWPSGKLVPGKAGRFGSYIDILPTVLDVAGIDAPVGCRIDGRSLMPLFKGNESDWPDRDLFIQWHYVGENKPKKFERFMMRNDRFKLVSETLTARNQSRLRDHYRWCEENGYEDYQLSKEIRYELYEIGKDPGERVNLAAQHPEVLKDMVSRYQMWYDDVLNTRGVEAVPVQFDPGRGEPLVLISNWWAREAMSWDVAVQSAADCRVKLVWGNASQPELRKKHIQGNSSMRPMTKVAVPETANLMLGDQLHTRQISGPEGKVDFGVIPIPLGKTRIQSWINTKDTQLSLTTVIEKSNGE
jgi:arylsulfatase/arylsulfatase A